MEPEYAEFGDNEYDVGNLAEAYRSSVAGTLPHIDEAVLGMLPNRGGTSELSPRSGKVLPPYKGPTEDRLAPFSCAADGILYFMDDQKPKLAITRKEHNLVFRYFPAALRQLTEGWNFHCDPSEARRAIAADTTEVFDLAPLQLTPYGVVEPGNEFRYLKGERIGCFDGRFTSRNYDQLDPEERRLAERLYGKGEDFIATMAMLNNRQVEGCALKVNILNPGYVARACADGKVIARVAMLDPNTLDTNLVAYDRFPTLKRRLMLTIGRGRW